MGRPCLQSWYTNYWEIQNLMAISFQFALIRLFLLSDPGPKESIYLIPIPQIITFLLFSYQPSSAIWIFLSCWISTTYQSQSTSPVGWIPIEAIWNSDKKWPKTRFWPFQIPDKHRPLQAKARHKVQPEIGNKPPQGVVPGKEKRYTTFLARFGGRLQNSVRKSPLNR